MPIPIRSSERNISTACCFVRDILFTPRQLLFELVRRAGREFAQAPRLSGDESAMLGAEPSGLQAFVSVCIQTGRRVRPALRKRSGLIASANSSARKNSRFAGRSAPRDKQGWCTECRAPRPERPGTSWLGTAWHRRPKAWARWEKAAEV